MLTSNAEDVNHRLNNESILFFLMMKSVYFIIFIFYVDGP